MRVRLKALPHFPLLTLISRRAYAVVAWIWAFIWHLPLDLIKWVMAYILNEDGFRDRFHGRTPTAVGDVTDSKPVAVEDAEKPEAGKTGLGRMSAGGLNRVSASGRPSLARNSVQVQYSLFKVVSCFQREASYE